MTLGSIRHWIIFKRGSNLLRKERWQKAASVLGRAVRLGQDHWESHNNLAIAMLKLGRWEEAARVVQRAISLNATASVSHVNFGIALLKMERWEEAVAAYRRAIKVDPGCESSYERLGIALSRLQCWDEAAAAFQRAVELNPRSESLHEKLGSALSVLERWGEAVTAFRRAIDLNPDRPDPFRNLSAEYAAPVYRQIASLNPGESDSYAHFANALAKLRSSEETVAAHQQAVVLAPDDAAAYLSLGIELAKLERWDEAESALQQGSSLAPGSTSFEFLRVDPLVRLGRLQEAAASHSRTVDRGGIRPSLPGQPATDRFEQRRASFWTPENLGADVFDVERWLERLSAVPTPTELDSSDPRASVRPARLLFVLDNDYGELTTLMYLVLGQHLFHETTLLLSDRLYAHNTDAIAGRTHRYGSLEDVIQVVDREKPDVVFLCSGYLFCAHQIFSLETLERLVRLLHDRGCRVVTGDPFLGMLSRQDPRTLISIDIPPSHAVWSVEQLRQAKRTDEEAMWTYFSESERILKDTFHLYPSYCDVPEHAATRSDSRNISFYNASLIRPQPDSSVTKPSASDDSGKPHWMFILSHADYDTQLLFEGESRFADIMAGKLVETVAAGRHPILVAPKQFVEILLPRMPTAGGIDILSHCSFTQFMSLLLSAEHAFYWNVVSHSILIRLFNKLPIILFDRGHLVRNASAIYDRVVKWYYQGWEPMFRDHRRPLTLDTVSSWAEDYRQEAHRISERFRRAPTPEQLIANLVSDKAKSPI